MILFPEAAKPAFPVHGHLHLHTLKRPPFRRQIFQAETVIPGNYSKAFSRYIVSGWSCCQRISVDGRRQVFALMIPGDVVFNGTPHMQQKSLHAIALTKLEMIVVPVEMDDALEDAHQKSVIALYDQLIRLGSMNAVARMAHLLLDLHRRLAKVGLTEGWGFSMPLKQSVLADLLGMTSVHVSRTLQHLRRNRLIEFKERQVLILNAADLASITHKSD